MGRFFDRLCSVVERQFPSAELRDYLKRAALFDFPQRWHETSKAGGENRMADYDMVGGAEFVMDNFFLPFPIIAVEDSASVVIVVDLEPGQVGLNCERVFVECFLMGTSVEEFGYDGAKYAEKLKDRPLEDKLPPTACMVSVSRIKKAWVAPHAETGRPSICYEAELGFAFVADKKQMYLSPSQWRQMCLAAGDWGGMTQSAALNAKTALEEVMYFNTPHRFVVKRSAERPRQKKGKGPEFLRSHERDQYVLLQPHEIREKLGMPEPTQDRKSPVPHPRRRHFRVLKSERYKFDREKYPDGKKVIVPATWIGPSEGEHEGRRYEVCLDL
jgi:hypothetical protein